MKKALYYFGLTQGLLLRLFLFKTKTYYEYPDKPTKTITGSAVIISNHRSFMDGLVIALRFFRKRLHFLMADFTEYHWKGIKRFLIGAVKLMTDAAGGIYVGLNGQRFDFIEKCKKVTAKGNAIVIFPEGDYQHRYEPAKFASGYILIAVKTGAKIVPIVNDFKYGLFKRVHLMIGGSLDLSGYAHVTLTRELIDELNDKISRQFLALFYELKRRKAARFTERYAYTARKRGDAIRISVGSHYHYGIYLSDDEVIQFGRAVNKPDEEILVNSVPLSVFCGAKIPEVRVFTKRESRHLRKTGEIERYAKSCLGTGGYSLLQNNCQDFVNRVILNI